MIAVLAYGLLLSCLVQPLLSEQCLPDSRNPCIAYCNGTKFDISKLFDYPLAIDGFTWTPCKGMTCRDVSTGANTAVCQKADQYYNCGEYLNPIVLLDSIDPYRFRVEYTGGEQWRISVFEFIENKEHSEAKAIFTSENPELQYNFVVTGKCIGQPYCLVGH